MVQRTGQRQLALHIVHTQHSQLSVTLSLYLFFKDELIRETTINCAERGLLLLRVRDEIQMTIAAYQTLYESSIAFGMRKALQAEQGKSDMEKRVSWFVTLMLYGMKKAMLWAFVSKSIISASTGWQ